MADLAKLGIEIDSSKAAKASTDLDKLTASSSKTERSFEKTGSASQKMSQRIEAARLSTSKYNTVVNGTASLLGRLTGIVGSLAIAFVSVDSVMKLDSYNVLQARIKQTTRATGDYIGVQKELALISKATGVDLETNVQVFQRLQLAAKSLGKSNEDVLKLTRAVSELGVIGGASPEASKFGLTQFGQAMSAGIVRAEEFNSVVENLPFLAQSIAQGLGMSTGELRQQVIAGKVLSKDVFEVIQRQAEAIHKDFKNMPPSIARLKNALGLTFVEFLAKADEGLGASGVIIQGLGHIVKLLDSGKARADLLAAAIIGVGLAISAAALAMTLGFGPAAAAATFGVVLGAAALVVGGMELLKTNIENTHAVTVTYGDVATAVFNDISEAIKTAFDLLKDFVNLIKQPIDAFNGFKDGVLGAVGQYLPKEVTGAFQSASSFAGGALGKASPAVGIFNYLSGLTDKVDTIASSRALKEDASRGHIMPVNGKIAHGFNEQRSGYKHQGWDIAVPQGTPVGASRSGTVVFAGAMSGYGSVVIVEGLGAEKHITQRYGHLSRINVSKGQQVFTGGRIGLSGGTPGTFGAGNSKGPHVHFEERVNGVAVNPSKFVTSDAVSNSPLGAVNNKALADEATAQKLAKLVEKRKEYIETLNLEKQQQDRLLTALKLSEAEYEKTKMVIEAENGVRGQKLGLSEKETLALIDQNIKIAEQKVLLENLVNVKQAAAQAMAAGLSGVASAVIDPAKNAGGDSGKDMLGKIKFIQSIKEEIGLHQELLAAQKEGAVFNNATQQFEFQALELKIQQLEREKTLRQEGFVLGSQAYNLALKELEARDALINQQEQLAQKQQSMLQFQQQLGDAFTQAFEGAILGTMKLKDALRQLLQQIASMLLHKAIGGLFTKLLGGLFGGGGVASAASHSVGGSLLGGFAHGGAFDFGGEVTPFAKGGIVGSPTLFKFASGGGFKNGLMGEAGREAIMPLKRLSNGDLGIQAMGAGGGGNVVQVNNNVQFHASGNKQTDEETLAKMLKSLEGTVRSIVTDENTRQLRPGGQFKPMIQTVG